MKVTPYYCFVIIGCCFGFIPWISLRKKVLTNKLWANVYTSTVTLVFFLGLLQQFGLRFVIALLFSNAPYHVLIFVTFTKRKYWENWIRLYEVTDRLVKVNLNKRLKIGWKTFFMLIIYLSIFIAFSVGQTFNANYNLDFLRIFVMFMRCFAECLPIIFSTLLTEGFKILNGNVKNFIIRDKPEMHEIEINSTNLFVHKSIYKNLYDMSVSFNKVFGVFFISIFGEVLIGSCIIMSSLTRTTINLDFTLLLIILYVSIIGVSYE